MKRWDDPEELAHRYMVSMTYHFGLRPWEIDRLTVVQFDGYAAAVDNLNRKN